MRASDRHRLAITALIACGIAAFHILRIPHVIVDDAFISFRYADKLVAGDGLVFNPGDHVEGYSNFLWVLLAAAGRALHLDPVAPTRAIGAAATLGTILVTIHLTWRLTRSHAAAAAAAIVLATSTALCGSAVSGLETGLFGFLITLAAALFIARRPASASLCWGLAAITRPEGAALWIVAMFCLAVCGGLNRVLCAADLDEEIDEASTVRLELPSTAQRRIEYWARLITPCAALFGGLLLFRRWYFGEWMPNSVVAKSAMFPLLAKARAAEVPGLLFNRQGLTYAFEFLRTTAGLFTPLILVPLMLLRVRRLAALFLTSSVLLGCTIAVYNFGDWMTAYRLLTPYMPALVALVCWGAAALVRRIPTPSGPTARTKVTLASCAIGFVGAIGGWQRDMPATIPQPDEELAAVLEHSHQPDLLVATDVLGRVSYFAPSVRVLDMAGLADAYIARHGEVKAPYGKWNMAYVLSQRPHLLMTNVLNAWKDTPDDAAFNAEYEWMDEPSWRPDSVEFLRQRVIFVRRGSVLAEELRAAYPLAAWRAPHEIEQRTTIAVGG